MISNKFKFSNCNCNYIQRFCGQIVFNSKSKNTDKLSEILRTVWGREIILKRKEKAVLLSINYWYTWMPYAVLNAFNYEKESDKEESKKAGLKLNIQKTKIMASTHHFLANRWRNNENSDRLYCLRLQNHCRWWLQPWN